MIHLIVYKRRWQPFYIEMEAI